MQILMSNEDELILPRTDSFRFFNVESFEFVYDSFTEQFNNLKMFSQKQPVVPPTVPIPLLCAAGLVQCCQPGPYQCGVRYPPVAGGKTMLVIPLRLL